MLGRTRAWARHGACFKCRAEKAARWCAFLRLLVIGRGWSREGVDVFRVGVRPRRSETVAASKWPGCAVAPRHRNDEYASFR